MTTTEHTTEPLTPARVRVVVVAADAASAGAYVPARSRSHWHPEMRKSTMKRSSKGTLASYVAMR